MRKPIVKEDIKVVEDLPLEGMGRIVDSNYNPLESKTTTLKVDLTFDPMFMAILPAVNVNFHSKEFELEWLFFGVYIGKMK